MTPALPLLPPLGAVVTAFFLLVFPVALLVAVWAVVTLYRVLFPERTPAVLPPRQRGAPRPVSAREIIREQRTRASEASSSPRLSGEHVATADFPARTPLEEALWSRRN